MLTKTFLTLGSACLTFLLEKLGKCNGLKVVVVKSYVMHHSKYQIMSYQRFFTIRVFGWMLMDGHELYTKYQRSFLNVTFSKFIVDLAQLQLCNGIQKLQILLKLWTFKNTVLQKLLIILHIRLLPKPSYIKLNLIVVNRVLY